MRAAAVIVGIDGWEQYTLPLVQSIQKHEPATEIIVIDNESAEPYPLYVDGAKNVTRYRVPRCCYAKALNTGAAVAHDPDWYIFLSNDVLCYAPFMDQLKSVPPWAITGPQLNLMLGYRFIVGWCMCIPRHIWQAVGAFDEQFLISAWEDTDYSYRVLDAGFRLIAGDDFPFTHLDQRQRNTMGINAIHVYNGAYFERKHHIPRPLLRYSPASLLREEWR